MVPSEFSISGFYHALENPAPAKRPARWKRGSLRGCLHPLSFPKKAWQPGRKKVIKERIIVTKKKSMADPNDKIRKVEASELMKKVAAATGDEKKMKKVFSKEELTEIMGRIAEGEEAESEEKQGLTRQTRANKQWVINHSAGVYDKIFFYPSYTAKNGKVWYKALDFSALYFANHIAPRLGKMANIYPDDDRYSKASYSISIYDGSGTVAQIAVLKIGTVEQTDAGIYIVTLMNPSNVEEYTMMKVAEDEKKERARNILRPYAMAPLTYKKAIDTMMLFIPKINKMDKRYFFSFGEKMAMDFRAIFETYYMFSDGFATKEETGKRLLVALNSLKSSMSILQEARVFDDAAKVTMLADSLNQLRQQILKDFNITVGSERRTQC